MKGISMGKVVKMCDGCEEKPVDFFIENKQNKRLNMCNSCGLILLEALRERYEKTKR